MKIFRGDDVTPGGPAQQALKGGSVVSIGNFDGVHLGHREILDRVHEKAGQMGLPSVVMTFDPHPRKVLSSPESLRLITDVRVKCAIFELLEVDVMAIINFTREFASESAEQFIDKWLMMLSPRQVIVGYDFNFGRGGAGSIDMLETEGARRGFDVEVAPALRADGMVVSSSRIRNLVEGGEVALAEKLLGRPYSVFGPVIKGHGRGKRLGIPTANIGAEAELLPCDGVYAGEVVIEDDPLPAMVNVGANPTFDDMHQSVEACILDFDKDIYGKELELRFRQRVRSEIKFPGPDELVAQIEKDKKSIRKFFEYYGASSTPNLAKRCPPD